jgi:carbonic anhydrase
MKTAIATTLTTVAPLTFAGSDLWSYFGATGPENWGRISPDWAVCERGQYQSPIDLRGGYVAADLGEVDFAIKSSNLRFGLDGPTFAVPYDPGSMLTINNTQYEVQQFHFHHPSEHTVDGKHYTMEAHLVLKSVGSDHANSIMGVFIEEGKANAMLDQFWGQLPRRGAQPERVSVNVGDLLPDDTRHYMYEGSMTTPGCRQGVRWFVMETPVQASKDQVARFIEDFTAGESNNRPVQPTNGRVLLRDR